MVWSALSKMLKYTLLFTLVTVISADDPIVHLYGQCPDTNSAAPSLHLTADVPAYALAKCRNGDKTLTEVDEVNFQVEASFDQAYIGENCLFYKKDGSNTYTVDVEVGWGERNGQIIQQRKIHTISCAYDAHGNTISSSETISDWFLNPWESQTLLGGNSSANFVLRVMDVLDQEITTDHISIGRKIRLVAEDLDDEGSGEATAFRALSCSAHSSVSSYYILRAGCGDGLIFPKLSGFVTVGNRVYSPYFDAFKLSGGDDNIRFECRFTECDGECDGDSCSTVTDSRYRRAVNGGRPLPAYVASSKPFDTV